MILIINTYIIFFKFKKLKINNKEIQLKCLNLKSIIKIVVKIQILEWNKSLEKILNS